MTVAIAAAISLLAHALPAALPAQLVTRGDTMRAEPARADTAHRRHDGRAAPSAHTARAATGTLALGAQAIGLATHVTPAIGGGTRTEGYLTQPMLMAHAALWRDRLALRASIGFEGATLRRGELTPGIYGEGYVDRRHPHTTAHELIASSGGARGPVRAALVVGKGFAPFGTDDPMARPFVKYPVNHHLAQILERGLAGAGIRLTSQRAGDLMLEGALFNGDEPVSAGSWPSWSRVGDSWTGRLTLFAPRRSRLAGLELQGSAAQVASPEIRAGGGTDQWKRSASLRFERGEMHAPSRTTTGRHRYLLVEWAHTRDYSNGDPSFGFASALAEGSVSWRGAEGALRYERTTRPEEERLLDPYRTVSPHTDASIVGRTRWDVLTLHVAPRVLAVGNGASLMRFAPFIEATHARAIARARPAVFDPASFYGRRWQTGLSLGLRATVGRPHARMGRYGVADDRHGAHPVPAPAPHDSPSGHAQHR